MPGRGVTPFFPCLHTLYKMALSTTMLAADFNYILADITQLVTYAGTSYSAVVSAVSIGNELAMEGMRPKLMLSVFVRQGDVNPTVGQKLTYSGTVYRITGKETSQDGVHYKLTCEELMA